MGDKTMRWMMIVCGAVALSTSTALAQSKEGDAFRWSVSGGAEWTDNRDSTAVKNDNVDIYIEPRIDANVLLGQGDSVFNFHYLPYFRWRDNPSIAQNDTELFHDLGAVLKYEMTPTTQLRLEETFNKTDDPAVIADGYTYSRDSSFLLNRFEAELTTALSDLSMFGVAGRSQIKRYTDELRAEESDEDQIGGGLTYTFNVSRETGLIAFGDAAMNSAKDSILYGLKVDRDYNTIVGGAGLDHLFQPGVRGGVRLGAQSVTYAEDSLDSLMLPYVKIVGSTGGGDSSRIKVSAGYSASESVVYPFASQNELEFYGKYEFDPSALITLGVMASYRMGSYSTDTLPPGGENYQRLAGYAVEGDRTSLVVGGDVTYRMTDWTAINVGLTHEEVSSDVSEEFDRNAATMFVTQQF